MTELAKILRGIRLENGQVLKDMSEALGVTSSYLSAVENGKRPMPEEWLNVLREKYCLGLDAIKRISNAADELRKTVKMDLGNVSGIKRDTAMVFARSFNDMDEKTVERIRKILLERGDA